MPSRYLQIAGLLLAAVALNQLSPALLAQLASLPGSESALAQTLWCCSLILGGGWACSKATAGTVLPSFTLQLVLGIVLHDALAPLAAQVPVAVISCTAMAAIILKDGGDAIDRKGFSRLALPTLLLALIGYLITFAIMDVVLAWLGLDGPTAALLAAIISSTDPAALIPTLRAMVFKTGFRHLADIAIAESAVNDATGAIATTAITAMVLAGTPVTSIITLTNDLAGSGNLIHLGSEVLFGIIAGLIGWVCMRIYEKSALSRQSQGTQGASHDFALVLALPLFVFLLAELLQGNGFLAAFVTGLLSNHAHSTEKRHRTLHVMETNIESVAKPVVFMMMGPFVSVHALVDTFWLGLIASLIFMLAARPLAVLLSLLPTRLSVQEKLFFCVVRETGVIPVVLAVITTAQLPQLSLLLPLTAWIVIWTLGLLPALTPWWARKLSLLQD